MLPEHRRRGWPKNTWKRDLEKDFGDRWKWQHKTSALWPMFYWKWQGASQVKVCLLSCMYIMVVVVIAEEYLYDTIKTEARMRQVGCLSARISGLLVLFCSRWINWVNLCSGFAMMKHYKHYGCCCCCVVVVVIIVVVTAYLPSWPSL